MGKGYLFTKKCVVCVGLASVLMCAGCGKSDKKDPADDFNDVTVEASDTDAVAASSDYLVPDHVKYDVVADSSKSSIHVDADVAADGFESASVYEVTLLEADEEYVKELATRIFDEGQYTVELPFWFMTKSQLNQIIEERNVSFDAPELDEKNCQITNYIGEYAKIAEETIDESQTQERIDDQIFYTYNDSYKVKQYDPTSNIYREVGEPIYDTMEYARLSGEIDGVPCQLMVRKSGEFRESRIWIVADETRTVGGNEYETDSTSKSENLCDYDAALKQADTMVAKITNSEYSLCKATARSVNSDVTGRGKVTNGYKFYYTPVVNDNPIVYNSSYTILAGTQECVAQPMLMVEMDDKGFVNAKYLTDITIDGCISDAPALLTFEQSEEEMKLQLKTYLDQESGIDFTIDKVQFSYVVLRQDNRYSIVPFWMYYLTNSGYQSVKEGALFGVNALDGSVVIFGNLIDDYFSVFGDR